MHKQYKKIKFSYLANDRNVFQDFTVGKEYIAHRKCGHYWMVDSDSGERCVLSPTLSDLSDGDRRVGDYYAYIVLPYENPAKPGDKYNREIIGLDGTKTTVDVYRVITAFGITDPATQHAVKKLFCAGLRGAKGKLQDLEEAQYSLTQAIELFKQSNK